MKRIITSLSALVLSLSLFSQDAAVIAITAPSSGCLGSTETVTITIFNYGPGAIAAGMPIGYKINGGAPVTDVTTVGIGPNSSISHSFTGANAANLSTPGVYVFDAYTALGTETNTANDTLKNISITSYAPSVGGTISGAGGVCISGNSGTLTLSGHTGNVVQWEYSTNGGTTWIPIANTTTAQNYTNVTVQTLYRVLVQNASCTSAYSSTATLTIDPATVGGNVLSSATVCSGSSGSLSLSGQVGSVLSWQYSTNGGATWTDIANTTTIQSYINITTTTRYRAVVKSGSCTTLNSNQAIITVNAATVGGSVNPAATTVCSGANSGTLTLSGHTGSVQRWQYSTNGGTTWINITNTTVNQNYTNLTATRMYRAQVKSGVCAVAYSAAATVTVVSNTVAGAVTPSATVCSGANSGTLTLGGHSGTILSWQFSTDGGATWTPIANTTTTENYTNLTVTTRYRAVVQNGSCTVSNSTAAIITVDQPSVPGSVASDNTVCEGSNSGTLTLSGHTGSILSWDYSTDGGTTWTNIANTTTTQSYTNLTATTLYAAVVKNGACPADTASLATITVDPITVAGNVATSATVCNGNNSGTLNLVGNTGGVVNWEYSTDGGLTWVTIVNTATSQNYNNVSTATLYRALVKSGTCSAAYSGTATLTTDPAANGGTTYGATTVCSGANSGNISLIGYSANIVNWEYSTDGGTTWNVSANTTSNESYSNITQSTMYRAIVASGVCPNDTSTTTTVLVDNASVGGLLAMSDTVCSGSNRDTIDLSGHTGNVLNWEYSTNGGVSWNILSNTSVSQIYLNLTATTWYRVNVKNGVCPSSQSDTVIITVDAASNAGNILSSTTVCEGANSGNLLLSGNSGAVLSWLSSSDNGVTWNVIANTTTTEPYLNLTDTMYYAAIVQSGVCGADTTSPTIIYVDAMTAGGNLSFSDTVCASMNLDTINLANQTGNVLNWEYSTNGGVSWNILSNTTTSQIYSNLTSTTLYRAVVKNGVCPTLRSDTVTIKVDAATVPGNISSNASVCEGSNAGTLVLSGYTGTILSWVSSSDNGVTWTPIANTGATQTYLNLTDTTYYAALLQSGVCAADTSAPVIITVNPKPVATFATQNTCFGNASNFTNTSTVTGNASITGYNWDFGDFSNSNAPNPSHIYASAGSYTVTLIVTSTGNCSDTISTATTVYALPLSTITSSTGVFIVCEGDSLQLSAPLNSGYMYSWNVGGITQSITVDTSGYFTVTVVDVATSCMSSDSVYVQLLQLPYTYMIQDTTISMGTSIQLYAGGGIYYSWLPTIVSNPNIPNPTAAPNANTTFYVSITGANGCVVNDSVLVTVVADFSLLIPNMITPNGDGYNDNFFIQNLSFYPDNELTIFNRNGQQVYNMKGYNNTWDGTYNNNSLPDGAYYYVLSINGNEKTFKGTVTVLRNK